MAPLASDRMKADDWRAIEFFQSDEFDYPDRMTWGLLVKLDAVRREAGVPLYIFSDYRPGDDGAHGKGLAVDVHDDRARDGIASRWRHKVLRAAYVVGFRRIGIYDAHLHLDIDTSKAQDVSWWGESS